MDIKAELKKIILNTKYLNNSFIKKHPNTKYSLDLIIDEILYFLKSGTSWRMLRSKINSKTLFYHYSRFVKYNIFYKLFRKIRNKYVKQSLRNNQNLSLFIDSSIIYNKCGINKIGRNKFYKNKKTTKLSLLTDSKGFPLSVLFMKGNYHDNRLFSAHIRDALIVLPKNKLTVIADKAYSSNKNYLLLQSKDIAHIIPPRKNMKKYKTYAYDQNKYIKRIKIEHIFGRLKAYKRISNRYDKFLRNFSGFVFLAISHISNNIILKND